MGFIELNVCILLLIFSVNNSIYDADNNMAKRSWNEKLGRCDFTLAFILLNARSSSIDDNQIPSECFSNMPGIVVKSREFVSWIIYGQAGGMSTFLSRSIDLSFILFKHKQYGAAEVIFFPFSFFSWSDKFNPLSIFYNFFFLWSYLD